MHPLKQLRQSFCSQEEARPQRWDRADGQAFDDRQQGLPPWSIAMPKREYRNVIPKEC